MAWGKTAGRNRVVGAVVAMNGSEELAACVKNGLQALGDRGGKGELTTTSFVGGDGGRRARLQ
jgi:hypothetical protein